MAILQRLTDDELKALAERLLAPEMADLDFRGVKVDHREIYDDGPSLYVGLKVGPDVPAPFDPDRRHRFFLILHEALLDRGDERFPYLTLERAEDVLPEPFYAPVDP